MITEVEYAHFNEQGLNKLSVDKQYALLTKGAQYSNLSRPAVLTDGIESLSKEDAGKLATLYENQAKSISILKFVPASGAATRMFKELVTFIETGIESDPIVAFLNSFEQFSFAVLVPEELSNIKKAAYILKNLSFESTPKGLIPFHQYDGFTRTAFKEHWIEGLYYAAANGAVNLHFTVSENHQYAFEQIYMTRITSFSKEYDKKLSIEFSQQDKSTDTIVVNNTGELVTGTEGLPITRPGGHGALINNLNELSADLVFVKNIDNVVHQNHLQLTTLYKKALAGRLIAIKTKLFKALEHIDNKNANLPNLEALGNETNIIPPATYEHYSTSEKIKFWKSRFNRPIRVCGMVKNLGEPGGGPFWVLKNESISLQIVEASQIDGTKQIQEDIVQSSTHFNPVDLMCYLTNYQGNKFDLVKYVDTTTAFVTSKTVNGKEVKVLEHPGLWNGAMADWITIFMEVPIETFNPVKTVNDLLKPMHIS